MTAAYMIYDKYAYALGEGVRELSRGNRIHIDAARLALRLALDELAESATATIDQGQPAIVPNALVEEVRSLETWLTSSGQAIDGRTTIDSAINTLQTLNERNAYQANKIGELTQQLAQLDADNAALIRRNKELSDELKQARLDRQESAFSGISATITDHPNGTAVTIAPAPINHQITLDYSSLSSENVDWCDGLDADRQQWRHLPKRTRLELVRWILSHDAAMTMAAFDAIRPEWMPTAGSHCKTFNMTWEQLNDFTVDLEVTR